MALELERSEFEPPLKKMGNYLTGSSKKRFSNFLISGVCSHRHHFCRSNTFIRKERQIFGLFFENSISVVTRRWWLNDTVGQKFKRRRDV